MTIRAAIVDDEPLASTHPQPAHRSTDVEVIAECANGREAIGSLEESPPGGGPLNARSETRFQDPRGPVFEFQLDAQGR